MERYEAYKDSGVEWIGDIPEGWYVRRIKTAVRRKSESGHPEETVLSLYRDYGIVIKDSRDDNFNKTSENIDSYRFVEIDDLVVNKMKAWQGSLAVSKYQGIVSPAYYVYTITSADIVPHYMHYQLRDSSYLPEYRRLSGGIRPAQWDLSSENFVNIPMLVPTLYEQEAIADYLDAKTTEIDALVADCEREVDLLREYRKAVISEAVTKGLDPDAPMRDSGVEWIGEIPEGWGCIKAKYVVKISNGSDPQTVGDIPVFGSGEASFKTCGEYKEPPATLIGRKGATLHIPHFMTERYWNVDTAFNVNATTKYLDKYYYYVAMHFDYRFYLSHTTLPSMTQTAYENMLIPLPPLAEQAQIVEYLDIKTAEIDSLIEAKRSMADKLREYRKSLISEAVTGKFKVPGAGE